MENKESAYERYLKTYSGSDLLKKHSLDEYGVWEVKGEDPNCDLGGPHHQPDLGMFEGKLRDVLKEVVEMSGFWQWGAGGSVELAKKPTIIKVTPEAKKAKLEEKLSALRKQEEEIKTKILELETADLGPISKCKRNTQLPEVGTPVKIRRKLGETTGFLISEKHLKCRKPCVKGTYDGYVPGHGGDVWWIKHEDGTTGAYSAEEVVDI